MNIKERFKKLKKPHRAPHSILDEGKEPIVSRPSCEWKKQKTKILIGIGITYGFFLVCGIIIHISAAISQKMPEDEEIWQSIDFFASAAALLFGVASIGSMIEKDSKNFAAFTFTIIAISMSILTQAILKESGYWIKDY